MVQTKETRGGQAVKNAVRLEMSGYMLLLRLWLPPLQPKAILLQPSVPIPNPHSYTTFTLSSVANKQPLVTQRISG